MTDRPDAARSRNMNKHFRHEAIWMILFPVGVLVIGLLVTAFFRACTALMGLACAGADEIGGARLGMTQAALARALGVDPRTVRRWEAGDRRVPAMAERLVAIREKNAKRGS